MNPSSDPMKKGTAPASPGLMPGPMPGKKTLKPEDPPKKVGKSSPTDPFSHVDIKNMKEEITCDSVNDEINDTYKGISQTATFFLNNPDYLSVYLSSDCAADDNEFNKEMFKKLKNVYDEKSIKTGKVGDFSNLKDTDLPTHVFTKNDIKKIWDKIKADFSVAAPPVSTGAPDPSKTEFAKIKKTLEDFFSGTSKPSASAPSAAPLPPTTLRKLPTPPTPSGTTTSPSPTTAGLPPPPTIVPTPSTASASATAPASAPASAPAPTPSTNLGAIIIAYHASMGNKFDMEIERYCVILGLPAEITASLLLANRKETIVGTLAAAGIKDTKVFKQFLMLKKNAAELKYRTFYAKI